MSYESALFPSIEKQLWFLPARVFLSIISLIYLGLVKINLYLYAKGYRKKIKLTVPVVSVGNLTVGGSGKTPFILYLIDVFRKKNMKPSVVSRNYKASSRSSQKLDSSSTAQDAGDEPFLIWQATGVPTYVGNKKWFSAMEIARNEKVDVILIDDGFQHHRLDKTCEILLLDVTQMDKHNYIFPRGRYRESLESLKRAHILVWTKTNFISLERLLFLKSLVNFSGLQLDCQYLPSAIIFPDFPSLSINLNVSAGTKEEIKLPSKRWVLISAIARPEFLLQNIKDLFPAVEVIEKIFSDHHQYTMADLKFIFDRPINYNHYLTTEKDYTKLKPIWPKEIPLGILKQSILPSLDDEKLYEVIDRIIN